MTQTTSNTYVPGVYTTSLILNDNVVEIEVTVDERNINSIRLVNLDEAVTTMYPLIGFEPAKIYRIARVSFAGRYTDEIILKWLKTFYRRFFAQQFKRSCLPDGPKVGSVAALF